jgi:taurine dioxygenase
MGLEISRLGSAAGAEAVGIDLNRSVDDSTFARLHDAFLANLVLVIRDQNLTPESQVAFSRRFGPLEKHVLEGFALPDNPDIFVVSNKKEGGKPKGAIYAGQYWHTDLSYVKVPSLGSLLHAREVPSIGGDTMFANMYLAYETLSPKLREILEGLSAVHDYSQAYEKFFSKRPDRPPLTPEQKAKVPPVEHPCVRTHPETGRKVLFVNPGFTRRFVGMSDEESQPLLEFLFAHATRPEFVYRHRWRVGDLVIWDNRCTMHNAVSDYDMAEPRHMHRTTVAGTAVQ